MPQDQATYSPGATIADRYTVLELIGIGGLGEVYKVEDDQKQQFACKVLPSRIVPVYIKTEKIKNALIDQAPEIPGLIRPEYVLDNGKERLVISKLVQGADMRTIFSNMSQSEKGIEVNALCRMVDKLLATISAFPPLSVHGLLKPSNILVQDAGPEGPLDTAAPVFVTDFGASRLLSFSKFASVQLGRGNDYYYLAPEFISQGGRVGRVADIYSIGVLLYEGLSGQVPKKDPIPLMEIAPDVPPALSAAVDRAISKQPDARYPEFGMFRDTLRAVLPDLPEYKVVVEVQSDADSIGEEDIFTMDDSQDHLSEDVEDVDVFGSVEAVGLDEVKIEEQPEGDDDIFGIDSRPEVSTENVEDEVDVFGEPDDSDEEEAEEMPEESGEALDFSDAELEEQPAQAEAGSDDDDVVEAVIGDEAEDEDEEQFEEEPEPQKAEPAGRPPVQRGEGAFGKIIVILLFLAAVGALLLWKFLWSKPLPKDMPEKPVVESMEKAPAAIGKSAEVNGQDPAPTKDPESAEDDDSPQKADKKKLNN